MSTVSDTFALGKKQSELDFVDVELANDSWLFVDPFALSQRPDRWSQECHTTLRVFFQALVDAIRAGDEDTARRLLSHLQEPKETRLGKTKIGSDGAGIGDHQAGELFEALKDSSAVKTGFLSSLEEAELMIDGIGHDKISDLTTNVIRRHLVEYTQAQCFLHKIPTQNVALPPLFNSTSLAWDSEYAEMPVVNSRLLMLVPKIIVRREPAYEYGRYYNHYVLNFLQAQELAASSSLVRTLRNGNHVVYKKDLKEKFPLSKKFLYQFSKDHPDVLRRYREDLEARERVGNSNALLDLDESAIAEELVSGLKAVPAGPTDAGRYHSLMIGVLEFVFYPHLMNPRKEKEIHEGRKRIDILMENGARSGLFERLHTIRQMPCAYVPVECKNYTREITNPELDQIAGRFSSNRGVVGIVCCRSFEDRTLFVARCRDTFTDGRGLVMSVDDTIIVEMLELIRQGKRRDLEQIWTRLTDEVCL